MPKKRSATPTSIAPNQPKAAVKKSPNTRIPRPSATVRGIGMAGFDFEALNGRFRATPSNDASRYGVMIQPAAVAPGAPYWKVIGIYHLSPEENGSRHNIFVDVVDETGARRKDVLVGWNWEGNGDAAPQPRQLDKPDNEPGCDIPLSEGDFKVWIMGDASETATGMHYRHADEAAANGELLNTFGHHSFYVVFQRTRQGSGSPTSPDGHGVVVTPPTKPIDAPPAAVQWIGVVTAGELNVRRGAGQEHERLGSLLQNQEVQVVEVVGDWLRIVWRDETAFVSAKFVVNKANVGRGQPNSRLLETWTRYRNLIEQESARLGIDPAVGVAILVAESNGAAFDADGRMIIRFENHIFHERWGRQNEARFRQHFSFDPDKIWRGHQWRADANGSWQACHINQQGEWQVFDFARTLDASAAMCSISMGAPQIMGFNHQMIGYPTVQEMFDAFQTDDVTQIGSLFRFIEVNRLVDALNHDDILRFATVYNGSGDAPRYEKIIRTHLNDFRTLVGGNPPVAPSAAPLAFPGEEVVPDLREVWQQHLLAGLARSRQLLEQAMEMIAAQPQTSTQSIEDAIRLLQVGIPLHTYWARMLWAESQVAQSSLEQAAREALEQLRNTTTDAGNRG